MGKQRESLNKGQKEVKEFRGKSGKIGKKE
jgi:hypothetical protein